MRRAWFALTLLLAVSGLSADDIDSLKINEFMAVNVSTLLSDNLADFPDWIELYNGSDLPISLDGLFLTDDLQQPLKWRLPPDMTMAPHDCVIFWADGEGRDRHANFKLGAAGETLGLFREDGSVVDTVTYGVQYADISYGRVRDGHSSWGYFSSSTGALPNVGQCLGSGNRAEAPSFSIGSGLFTQPVSVSLSADPGCSIYYTVDGSFPTRQSIQYSSAIVIDTTTVVRARAYSDSLLKSDVVTHSYIFNETTSLPVISISTNPAYLFDEVIGITPGITVPVALGSPPPFDPNANFWNRWERPVHIEYFDSAGVSGFSQVAGVKLFGGMFGRQIVQKAFTLYARDKYGDSDFDERLFSTRPMKRYKRFLLRASSNDYNRTFFRDAMMNTMVIGQMDIDYMAYEPAIVYINGVFWGLYNIREKMNEFYPESNYGVDKDNVDLLEGTGEASAGSADHYQALLDYVKTNDLSDDSHYQHVAAQIDITEYMNYFIAQLYFRNHDWLHQNIKFWREQASGSRYRWMLYDTDWGFGGEVFEGEQQYRSNSIHWAMNQGEASELFVSLLENRGFRETFAQRMKTHLNLTFEPGRVLDIIERLMLRIMPEMGRQIDRWGAITDMAYWDEQIEVMREFALYRPGCMVEHLCNTFSLPDTTELMVEVSDPDAGIITIMDTPLGAPVKAGMWFKDIPIRLQAVPRSGYRFVRWEGFSQATTDTVTVVLADSSWIMAMFEPSEQPDVMISEIHYNASKTLQGKDDDYEFVEIFNNGASEINLAGWRFTSGFTFVFPAGSRLASGKALIVASNRNTYSDLSCQVYQFTDGSLSNGGELLTLSDASGAVMDTVRYQDESPWPAAADGQGPSLELISVDSDNSQAANWQASQNVGGSPGMVAGASMVQISDGPENFTLMPNYPNPFNPMTQVRFAVPRPAQVKIVIYNVIGQQVTVLLDDVVQPGTHSVRWEAATAQSGIYFIKMESGDFNSIQKCMLIK